MLPQSTPPLPQFRRIATEEAFQIPEIAAALREVIDYSGQCLDLPPLRKVYLGDGNGEILKDLLDIDGQRLRKMDSLEIDMHLLSLSCPGVQLFDADLATDLAVL